MGSWSCFPRTRVTVHGLSHPVTGFSRYIKTSPNIWMSLSAAYGTFWLWRCSWLVLRWLSTFPFFLLPLPSILLSGLVRLSELLQLSTLYQIAVVSEPDLMAPQYRLWPLPLSKGSVFAKGLVSPGWTFYIQFEKIHGSVLLPQLHCGFLFQIAEVLSQLHVASFSIRRW